MESGVLFIAYNVNDIVLVNLQVKTDLPEDSYIKLLFCHLKALNVLLEMK